MKLKFNGFILLRLICLLSLIFLSNILVSNAQSLEMTSGAGNPTGNGPSVSNQVITFQKNTNDPTGTTFTTFSPTTTATFSLSNQQYTLPTNQMSTGTGLVFGGDQNTGGILATGRALFPLMNSVSSPANNQFTSRHTVTAGNGIAVATNRSVGMFTSARPLYNANSSRSGRYYYGDLVITFNRPVNNPMIHIVGLGGTSGGNSLGITSELELSPASAAQMTLSEVSGSTEFNVTTSAILNSAGTIGATTGSGAASGTVRVTGTNLTSITFRIYMRSDNRSGGSWGGNSLHNGDAWLVGVSMAEPVTVSGNVFNDPDAGNVNNSSGTTNAVPSGMFANLVDSNNRVVTSASVATNGTYSFSAVFAGSYTVVLSTTAGTQGASPPSAGLPSGWTNTGEFNGTQNTGNDGNVKGTSASFTVGTSNVSDINFGIRQQRSDLTLSKSHTGNFTIGSSGTYSFTVTNSGTASSSGTITVTDTLPTGLTVNGGASGGITEGGTNSANWTCNSNSSSPQTITCTSSTAIAVSGTSVFNFAVNVGTSTAVGTNSITNTATVSGGGESNTSNNSASDPTTVLAPDLTIAKSHTGNFTVDSLGNYSFTVTNSGTASTSGTITVSDTLPSGLVVNGGSAGAVTLGGTNSANWSCNSNSSSPQTITCTSSTAIAASGSSTFNFNVYVGGSTPVGTNSITNTVSVSGGGEVNTANNTASDPTTVLDAPSAPAPGTVCTNGTAVNLLSTTPFSRFYDTNTTTGITDSIPLIANASSYRSGTGASNRIIVDLSWAWNNGEPSASSTQSTYTLVINGTNYARITTDVTVAGTVATVAGLNGASVSDTTIAVGTHIPSNYQQSYVTLPSSITQITSGSIVFAAPGAAPGDDIGVRISTIYACSPALSVTKSSNGPWTIGQPSAEYTLTVTNSGAATTFGTTTVRDALPGGITPNWTGTRNVTGNGLNWACTFSGQNVTCTTSNGLSNTAGSNTSQIILPVNVTGSTPTGNNSITNYASVGGGGDPYNSGSAPTPNSSCTNASHCTSNQTTVNSNPPNVELVKSCPSPANCTTAPQLPGTDITYKIEFTNTGGLGAANLKLVDGIPANMDYKLGSAAATVGTTGLTFVIEYSSDYDALTPALATWIYTPVSTGGGAPAGYDRLVKAIRWRVTSGTLSNVSPNNTGDISFIAKIR